MTETLCPLCGSGGCIVGEALIVPDAVKYWCQQNCDIFIMDGVFLQYVWTTVKEEDRSAIAAYMKATKGTRPSAPLIHMDNYREYVLKGKKLRRDTPAFPATDEE